MHLGKRAIAEFHGTFWLTFDGCGSAVIAAAYPQLGIGFLGVALAFGLTVVTMAYAPPPVEPGRRRRPGGGRKALGSIDPKLLEDRNALVEPDAKTG
jgi:Major intrinsic protein